jgi:hypothetical protein
MILVDLSKVVSEGVAKLKAAQPVGFYYQDADFLKIFENEINLHAAKGERFCGLVYTHTTEAGGLMVFKPLQGKHKCKLVMIPELINLTTLDDSIKIVESHGQLISSFMLQGFHPIYIFEA